MKAYIKDVPNGPKKGLPPMPISKRQDNEREMLFEFIHEMNLSQLEKLSTYAVKLLSDKRYKCKNTNKYLT